MKHLIWVRSPVSLLVISMWMAVAPQAALAQSSPSASSSAGKPGGKYPSGIQAEVSAGGGTSSILNTDGTSAYYTTLAVEGRGLIPLFGGDGQSRISLSLVGGIRYLDLSNSVTMGSQKEVANMIGPGAGLQLRLFKFVGGMQYDYMLARHYAIGPMSRDLEYQMPLTKTYYGLQIPFGQLAIAFTYSSSTGTVPKAATRLSADSPYADQLYWLNFTYSTGASFWRFLEMLF